MGLLKQQAANGTTPAAPAADKKTEEAKAPATPPAGSIYAKDGKEGESYKVGERMGVFQACAGSRVFFVAADGAPFTCTASDMITPASNAAPAAAPAFGNLEFAALKMGEPYVLDAKGTIGEYTGTAKGIGFFAVGEAMVKLPAGSKVEACKAQPSNAVLPKDAPASAPPGAVAPVTKGGDDSEDDEPEGEEEEAAPAADTKPAETPAAPAAPATEAPKAKGRGKAKSDPTDADLKGANHSERTAFILVVGATPTKGAVDLSKYVADIANTLAAKEKLVDVRCAPKESALAYDGWKALMRASAIKSPPTGLCFIYPGGLNDPVIEGLATVADSVIRA